MKLRHIFLFLIIATSVYSVYRIQYSPYDNPLDIAFTPTFTAVPLPFSHDFKQGISLPFSGGAIIEVDNDSVPEIFLSGGYLQRDGLYTYKNGEFKDISADSGLSKDIGDTGYGAASIDINADGYTDLLIARDSGLYLYLNNDGFFTKHKLVVDFAASESPISIALADINHDGLVDLFVSCFTTVEHLSAIPFSTHTYPASNKLLLNKGNYEFIDITKKAGLSLRKSAYTAVFAELNDDSWPDLIVAYQSEPAAIYQNLNGYQFKQRSISALDKMAFASSIAISDFNNDSKLDILLTTSGSTIPKQVLQYTLNQQQPINTQWLLLANQGDFKFNNAAKEYLLAEYELASSAAFADFNLDGLQDIIIGQNMIDFWPYWIYRNPGKLLIQKNRNNFADATANSHIGNRQFAIAPLLADFNQDGYTDLVWLNLNGPAQAFINNGGNGRYLQIDLGDTPEALGVKIWLETNDGQTLFTQQLAGSGLNSDHSHIHTLALSQEATIEKLTIQYPSGRSIVTDQVEANQFLTLKPERLEKPKTIDNISPETSNELIEELEEEAPEEALYEGYAQKQAKPAQSIEDDLEALLTE